MLGTGLVVIGGYGAPKALRQSHMCVCFVRQLISAADKVSLKT